MYQKRGIELRMLGYIQAMPGVSFVKIKVVNTCESSEEWFLVAWNSKDV
jgi:hypothetical protein